MTIKVSYTRDDGTEAMLAVSVGAELSVGDVAAQLFRADASRGGRAPAPDVTLAVTPRSAGPGHPPRLLSPETSFDASGVRSGDHLEIEVAGTTASYVAPVATAHIVAGPDAGAAFELHNGSSVIGRDPDVAVRLSDSLASKRHARITVGDQIEVSDMGSTNGVILGDAYVTRAMVLPGDRIIIGDTEIEIRRAQTRQADVPTTSVVSFTRSPRVVPPIPAEDVELPQPPARPRPRRFPGLALVAPVVLGLTMFLVTGRIISLIFVAMSPMMMIGNWWDAKRVAKRELNEKGLEFDEDLESARQQISTMQEREREVRFLHSPAVDDVTGAIRAYGPLMWTRRPEHEGFLSVRLGIGALPSTIKPILPSRGESYPGFWERLLELRDGVALLDNVPVADELRVCGNIGVAGSPDHARSVARSLVIQLAGLHSPTEVVLAALTATQSTAHWQWMSWLPHTSSPSSPIEGDHLSDSRAGSARLLTALEQVVAQRAGRDISDVEPLPRATLAETEPPMPPRLPAIVVVVEDDAVADRNRLIRLAEKGPDVNVHLVWISPTPARLPGACRTFVELGDEGGRSGFVRRGLDTTPLECDTLSIDAARDLARQMACVEDDGSVVDAAEDIPRSVSYLDLHGFESIEPAVYEQRWRADMQQGKRPFTLRALIGAGGDGPFYLDLRSQGPHALVGGTTGAGKSEFLQSWILGMAAAYGPDRVTFLFVDYKGGSAFADCINLPHAVGLVTDLTPQLVDRALTSLRAELHYRERLLQAKKAKDLETLAKTGDPDTPPSLVIVIDEFAALVQEVPDFVDGVVDIAQRGRSLGLHLIMATQRPAGVIKDNLRANTPLRIALRMADEGDSTDILGVRDAAHVDPSLPGRAMARTGPGRVLTFQAAYAGAHSTPDSGPAPISVHEFAMGTKGEWPLPDEARPAPVDGPPDAARAVAAMRQAMALLDMPAPRRPWLDELAATYELRQLSKHTGPSIVFGVLDDPAHQAQSPAAYEPDTDGNMVFYGSSGSGKSTALRSVAIGATLARDIAPVHVYGIDAAAGGLEILQPLPHVGDVIDVDDAERVARMLRRLASVVEERSARYSAARASSLTEYRATSGDRGEARILLLIDGYGNFQSEYMNEMGRQEAFANFVKVLTEGRAVGVHVVMSADRTGALHSSIQAQISRVIALRLNDENQYSFMGLKKMVVPADAPAGRALDAGRAKEIQIAVLGDSTSVAQQARHIEALAERIPDRAEWQAPAVPAMPAVVAGGDMPEALDGLPVLGIEERSLEPTSFTLDRPMIVAGQGGTGRSTALRWISESIAKAHPKKRQVLITLRRSSLPEAPHWALKAASIPAIQELLEELQPMVAEPGDGDDQVVLFIEAINDFNGTPIDMPLLNLLKELKRNGHALIGEAESSAWTTGMVLNEVKSSRRGLLLQPDGQDGAMLMGTQLPRMNRAAMPAGRGVFVENGRVRVVHIPLPIAELSTDSASAARGAALTP